MKFLKILLILLIIAAAGTIPAYFGTRFAFNWYFEREGARLVELEKRGLLSREYGAGWQDVLMDKAMELEAQRITDKKDLQNEERIFSGIVVDDYPSLSVVKYLNEVREYSNTILITDRRDRVITRIRTDHQRGHIDEFPQVLVDALIAAEDKNYRKNTLGIEFDSFFRAGLRAVYEYVTTGKKGTPRGTSTITQQTAKLFLSRLDETGQRHVSNSVNRKMRELRLAVALRKMYTADEILEVYMNHAVTSDFGLIGYKDIAKGLFEKELHELSDAECIYLARMVKWGRNVKPKIAAQCRIDMERMAGALGWDKQKQEEALAQIDELTFSRPKRIEGEHGPLVDLANEFWLLTLRQNRSSATQIAQMDLIDPNSLVRRKGNLTIKLTIDLALQQMLEKEINGRGYGADTITAGDGRRTVREQYFAYSVMCSQTGKLLAYHSRDRLGSRLNCLLRNRIPNGSSLAKPLFNALNYDLGVFQPHSRWTDALPVTENVPWSRTISYQGNRPVGVVFDQSAVRGRGWPVHNFGRKFEGCQYVFDLLTTSNNILGAETLYRLNRRLYDNGGIAEGAFPLVNFFYRVGALARVRDELRLQSVTGVRVYKELCRITGVPVDSMMQGNRRIAVSDSLYSVALGTLEKSLYEQMHLFNVLYNNDLIDRPAQRNSLVIESIQLNGVDVALNDTIRRYHPFTDINTIRPTLLGLHKRLIGSRWEGLSEFDVFYDDFGDDPVYSSDKFDDDAFYLDEPLSNFAKSGTTDDILRPFNVDASSAKRTNYCIWNAVLRVDMSRFGGNENFPSEIKDITISCIAEGNQQFTGPRDGKSQHRFITTALLKNAGVKVKPREGYFSRYEEYLKRVTPQSENCGIQPPSVPVSQISPEEIAD
ncbi:MAG: transglycosylase domain-containing protein [Chitinispirillia bacterium]|nr:transglycosylase domain-containing protein [Chitinispirillia bacterium]